MAAFHQWEATQYERAKSYVDPDLDGPVREILHDLAMSEIGVITTEELYERLRLSSEQLTPEMRVRVGDAMRRADWQKKANPKIRRVKGSPHSSWAWVPMERRPAYETDELSRLARAFEDESSDLSEVLAEQHASLSEALGVENYARYVTISGLLKVLANPRLKARSPNTVIRAAEVLLSKDGRLAIGMLARNLDELRLQARGPARTTQPALPEAQAPTVDADGVDFVVEPED